jgi:hypothetical protein
MSANFIINQMKWITQISSWKAMQNYRFITAAKYYTKVPRDDRTILVNPTIGVH